MTLFLGVQKTIVNRWFCIKCNYMSEFIQDYYESGVRLRILQFQKRLEMIRISGPVFIRNSKIFYSYSGCTLSGNTIQAPTVCGVFTRLEKGGRLLCALHVEHRNRNISVPSLS